MWSKLRSTLFKNTEFDVDIQGCHQSLMYDLLKPREDNYKLEALKRYVDNRDEVIEEIIIIPEAIERYNEINKTCLQKKDCIKSLFTILLYGGTTQTWVTEWGFDDEDFVLTDYVNTFIAELKENLIIICTVDKRFDDIVEWKKIDMLKECKLKYPDTKKDNRRTKKIIEYFDASKYHINQGKILSIILQDFERQIIELAISWSIDVKDLTVTSYNYDGFQILNNECDPITYIEELNTYIHNTKLPVYPDKGNFYKPDMIHWDNIKFIIKPFKDPLNMKLIPTISDEFDYDEFQLCEDYEYRKEYFEKFHFKCLNPICFIKIFPDGELQFMGHDKFNKAYRHLKAKYYDPRFDVVGIFPFIDNWLNDATISCYTKVGFYPKPLIVPHNHFNMWCDFPILKTELQEVEGRKFGELFDKTKIIHDHFLLMAGNGDMREGIQTAKENQLEIKEYLLNWFAHLVQIPSRKTEVCIVLKGEQGAGKSTIGERVMSTLIGDAKMFITGRTDKVFGKFSDLQGKLLCVLNEASGRETHDIDSILKDVITANIMQIEKKGIDTVGAIDYSNFLFTTNGFNAIKIPKDDRRFIAINCSNEKKNVASYFKPLYKTLDDLSIMRMFFQELMERDLSNFHPSNDRPYTAFTEVLKEVNTDFIDEFILYLHVTNDYEWNNANEIYEKLNYWWILQGRKLDQKPILTKFGGMMSHHCEIDKRRMSFAIQYKLKKK